MVGATALWGKEPGQGSVFLTSGHQTSSSAQFRKPPAIC